MRMVVAVLISGLLVKPTDAKWDTPYNEWKTMSVAFKAGYLTGFFEGHLNVTHVGDTADIREHFKTCLSFASNEAVANAMDQTVSAEPAMATAPVARVLMRTLFTMCGGLKN
jgi:hypothetical protein